MYTAPTRNCGEMWTNHRWIHFRRNSRVTIFHYLHMNRSFPSCHFSVGAPCRCRVISQCTSGTSGIEASNRTRAQIQVDRMHWESRRAASASIRNLNVFTPSTRQNRGIASQHSNGRDLSSEPRGHSLTLTSHTISIHQSIYYAICATCIYEEISRMCWLLLLYAVKWLSRSSLNAAPMQSQMREEKKKTNKWAARHININQSPAVERRAGECVCVQWLN